MSSADIFVDDKDLAATGASTSSTSSTISATSSVSSSESTTFSTSMASDLPGTSPSSSSEPTITASAISIPMSSPASTPLPSTSSMGTAAMAGLVIAVLVLILLFVLGLWLWYRRRRSQRSRSTRDLSLNDPQPPVRAFSVSQNTLVSTTSICKPAQLPGSPLDRDASWWRSKDTGPPSPLCGRSLKEVCNMSPFAMQTSSNSDNELVPAWEQFVKEEEIEKEKEEREREEEEERRDFVTIGISERDVKGGVRVSCYELDSGEVAGGYETSKEMTFELDGGEREWRMVG